jgi:putative restriction endonuclease
VVTEQGLRDAIAGLVRHRRGETRAPHKVLLLLDALARASRGEPRLQAFADAEPRLKQLIARFGPPARAPRPQYPFYRLANDADGALWTLDDAGALASRRNASGDVPLTGLRKTRGGLSEAADALVRARPDVLQALAAQLLEEFPPSLREEIADEVGLQWQALGARGRPRDPGFRELVLRIYERRCAVCGYDGQLGTAQLGLEAAHVMWHAYDGPDTASNGLALCAFHHKAFDGGALGVADDQTVLVSQHVHGSAVDELLLRHVGRPLRAPIRGESRPAPEFVRWHHANVFRAPARAA